ncbi:LysR family transcriptional regulator [Oryzibacter oryziterrae]|uniref:LysR family transcriptional regulator n=1 Tax=Oryzibacter oryziterrae TaxID=2766474 RepID=UPI001F32C1ED|nr:LysR family transcriptional regulator [Oryzibacter oryziterrae]
MDLDRLKTFLCVAESGSLSAASDLLRIAQPALSRQIRLLEDEVGQSLFVRSRRGMDLTAAGTELQARVSGLVRQLEQSFEDVRAFADRPRGQVTIGIVPTVAAIVAESLALTVLRDYPDVRLRFVEGYTGHVLDWLHHRDVDLALIYGPASELHMHAEPVQTDELLCVGPADHPALAGPVAVADLGRWPLVLPGQPHGLRLIVDRAVEHDGLQAHVVVEATSFLTILNLVAAGIGLTVLPRSIVSRFASSDRFASRSFAPPLSRQVVLAQPHGLSPSRAVQVVAPILAREAARLLA